uniref:Cysteine dioxygenase n=1 Tax=Bicosoecida sp. CB-2014 TaxID=1486930 RepID=A0A7S1CPC0_9STRA|mmetsp:Transcript_8137/g.28934  ORF Transcript_8137/g.28934 Transcript_8137/m.28934 type:complete len:273 (+) Transcript_8137:184-1002(+)|eukprot:CAMPEP_0203815794 /NCGR_PEP_ID=MMETSP0115-20131106/12114_1 /ASSEMBLY_ACC=CAM_ASM_000227 /TAXON_ID=33651 /ORGANISM="Bicosoecid sp, Strain ms1" /LENGTH=272 /DNA_ID=CAMNT_0050724693 /DNA_START=176 /DNA_END=994 /DNA_ORIENTATION=+
MAAAEPLAEAAVPVGAAGDDTVAVKRRGVEAEHDAAAGRAGKRRAVAVDAHEGDAGAATAVDEAPPLPDIGTEKMGLSEFVDLAGKIVKACTGRPTAKCEPMKKLFSLYDEAGGDWRRFAIFDEGKRYTRNLVATDDESFTLMLLCWNADQPSPIHDHPCDGCWLKVIEGEVFEERYEERAGESELRMTLRQVGKAGDIMYMDDSLGFHRVGAVGGPAVTLHLYSPPFQQCRAWMTTEVGSMCRPTVTYHSEGGEVIDHAGAASARACAGKR